VLDTLGDLKRTQYCGSLRASDADTDVVLMGWVHRRRDLGQLIFIDLRDRAGIVQVVFNKEQHPEAHAKAEELRSEFVVAVEGHLLRRGKSNPDLPTGEIEVVADEVEVQQPRASLSAPSSTPRPRNSSTSEKAWTAAVWVPTISLPTVPSPSKCPCLRASPASTSSSTPHSARIATTSTGLP